MTNIEQLLSILQEGQTLKITPQGHSMCPFFVGGRDDVYLEPASFPLKKGTIALFQRESGQYIIHRVYRIRRVNSETVYYMLGDNQTWIEGPITPAQIHAVTVRFMRKGKMIDCSKNYIYRFLSWLWMAIRPIRPIFIRFWIWIRPSVHKHQANQILKEIRDKTPH